MIAIFSDDQPITSGPHASLTVEIVALETTTPARVTGLQRILTAKFGRPETDKDLYWAENVS